MTSPSDYIISSFKNFENTYTDYLETFKIQITYGRVEIKFAFWPYDLIDKDLEFSEDYYDRLQETFREWIGMHAKVVASECKHTIELLENILIFRNVSKTGLKQIFEPLSTGEVKHITERIVTVSS